MLSHNHQEILKQSFIAHPPDISLGYYTRYSIGYLQNHHEAETEILISILHMFWGQNVGYRMEQFCDTVALSSNISIDLFFLRIWWSWILKWLLLDQSPQGSLAPVCPDRRVIQKFSVMYNLLHSSFFWVENSTETEEEAPKTHGAPFWAYISNMKLSGEKGGTAAWKLHRGLQWHSCHPCWGGLFRNTPAQVTLAPLSDPNKLIGSLNRTCVGSFLWSIIVDVYNKVVPH